MTPAPDIISHDIHIDHPRQGDSFVNTNEIYGEGH